MPVETRLAAALALSAIATLLVTPLAIAIARRTGFLDHPIGYKGHARATPYLGGSAVLLGFLFGALVFGGVIGPYWSIAVSAGVLWGVGTVDDRWPVSPAGRVAAEVAAAALIWSADLGWSVFSVEVLDFALTALWVVGIVNAVNLFDNMDGAASTIVVAIGVGVTALALVNDAPVLAALALSLSAACSGFLPFNLRSRIFLGDGGSMPIGLIAAASTMAAAKDLEFHGWATVLVAALMVGLPILDTTLVVVSRHRRRVSFLTGGRDHLTHRLYSRLGSTRAVAGTLGATQLGLGGVAVIAATLGEQQVLIAALMYVLFAAGIITVLERPGGTPIHQNPVV